MNGAHDLGGQHCLGAINPELEAEEPVFHAEWERRVFALTLATGMLGKWNIDEARFARERQHPVAYFSNSYYANWFAGLKKLLREKQLLLSDARNQLRPPSPQEAERLMRKGAPTSVAIDKPARFRIGDQVRVSIRHTQGHTRAPRYVQGAAGVIAGSHGCHFFPDARSQQQLIGEHVYSVRFSARELWGQDNENSVVFVDLWEPYLQSIPEHRNV